MLRGHLELCSPATVDALAAETGLGATLLAVGLATLESEGSIIQGRFTHPDAPEVEWCARRLLARMHGLSRARRRKSVESVSPEDFVRFLTRWHHVAPGTRVTGPAGLQTVLEKLQGWEAAVASWEPDLLTARLRDYQPGWLDRMCHDGELGWMRLHPGCPDDVDRRSSGPSKATPVSLVYRDELAWLLPAFRGDAVPPRPTVGAVAEIIEAIAANGPRFLTELATDTGRLATDIESALWEGVARGLFTADGFAAIRHFTSGPRGARPAERSLSKLRRSGVRAAQAPAAGRWFPTRRTRGPRTSSSRPSPISCWPGGACCSTTWSPTRSRRCRGATCNGRCGASRTGAWCAAAASSTASAASSSRSPRPSMP